MTTKRLQPGLYDILLIVLMVLIMLAIITGQAPCLHDFAEWLHP